MKRYQTYRHIRKKASIYGLPLGLFGVLLLSVIASLLVIIFSFSLGIVLAAVIVNLGLYLFFIQLTRSPQLLHFRKVFPRMISNKKSNGLRYED